MSEDFPGKNHEQHTNGSEIGQEQSVEILKATPEKEKPVEPLNDIDAIRASIENKALPAEAERPQEKRAKIDTNPNAINADFKNQALFRTLKNVRQHLSAPQRTLSKIVHQPVVDTVSEVSGKTIARPAGILGGGFFAFLGSLTFLYLAKHTGFRYNYLMFIVFFVGGFAVGLVLEMIVRLVYHPKQS